MNLKTLFWSLPRRKQDMPEGPQRQSLYWARF